MTCYINRRRCRRGETEALTQRWTDAEKTYSAYSNQYPDGDFRRRAQTGVGWARENQKRYKEAIEAYRNVVAGSIRDEASARCQFHIGECYFAMDQYDEAIKEFIKVEVSFPIPAWSSKALLEIGRCLEKQNSIDAAKDRYREVMEKYPDTDAATVAKDLIDKINNQNQ